MTIEFHRAYYNSKVWQRTYWLGHQVLKCPLDCWIYQELIFVHRPDVIVECGTWRGGSALFFGSVCELLGHGCVVTIDPLGEKDVGERPVHDRIKYIQGDSVHPKTFERMRRIVAGQRVMAVLDSDHDPQHVGRELEMYSELVTPGQALVVEDTNSAIVNGPTARDLIPVVDAFLAKNTDFQHHADCEKFLLTFNPHGWLQKKPTA